MPGCALHGGSDAAPSVPVPPPAVEIVGTGVSFPPSSIKGRSFPRAPGHRSDWPLRPFSPRDGCPACFLKTQRRAAVWWGGAFRHQRVAAPFSHRALRRRDATISGTGAETAWTNASNPSGLMTVILEIVAALTLLRASSFNVAPS